MSAEATQANPPNLSEREIGLFCYAMSMGPRQYRLATDKVIEQYSIGPRGVWILGLINAGPRFPLELTKVFGVGRSLITAELTRLAEAGLITMNKNETDGRRTDLALTPLGSSIQKVLAAEVTKLVCSRLTNYSREEILLCTRILQDFCGKNLEGT